MKIIHFINFFEPSCGYEEDLTAKYQSLNGHQVTILTTFHLPPRAGRSIQRSIKFYSSYTEHGVKIIRLPFIPLPSAATFHLGSLLYLTLNHYDAIHIHGLLNPISPLVLLVSKLKKAKVITDNHDFIYSTHQLSYRGLNPYKLFRLLEFNIFRKRVGKFLLNMSDAVLTYEEKTKNFLTEFYSFTPSKIITTTIGFDESHFYPLPNLDRNPHFITIGFIGQLSPRKRIEDLILLVSLLPDSFRLNLIGSISKTYLSYLSSLCVEKQISHKVTFKGSIDYHHLPTEIRLLDVAIYLNSSSIVCNQILGCGVPILISSSQQFAKSAAYYGKILDMNQNIISECTSWLNNQLPLYPQLSVDSPIFRKILRDLSFSATFSTINKAYSSHS